jgi:glycosyltransferase involved in cell wall biosynthesis
MRSVLAISRWPGGGIRTWFRYVYRDPSFDDVELTIVVPALAAADAIESDLADRSVKVVRLPASPAGFLRGVVEQVRSFRGDLVHSHGFSAAGVAAWPCRLRKLPHLVTQHDVILDSQFSDFSGKLQRMWVSCSLSQVSVVQPVSSAARRNLLQQFPRLAGSGVAIETVDNGIEVERFLGAAPADVRSELSLSEDDFLIGFFGRFMKQKGFQTLIDAVDALVRSGAARRPVVIAVGDGGFRAQEERQIRARGLEEHFRFMGFVPNVAGLMKGMDIVAMPSLWEACGLVAMEALVAGVPLVCSDCEALLDIAAPSPAACFPKGAPAALTQALAQAMADSRRGAFEAYAPVAAERFDARLTAKGIRQIYEQMGAGRVAGASMA